MLVWGGGLIYTPQTSRAAPSSEFWKRKCPKHTVLLQAVWCGSLIARSTFRSYFIKPSESLHHSFPLPPRSAQRAFGDSWRKYSPDHFPSQFHELSLQHCEKPLHPFPCSRNECSSSPLLLPAFALSTPTNGFAYGTRWERARSAGMHFATLSVHSSYHPHW